MALPPRREKPTKPDMPKRWVSHAHCTFVRDHGCSVPGCDGLPIEVAHLRIGTDAGMGRKASDWFVISLCQSHHSEQHRIGEASFAELYRIDLHKLAAAFARSSPKAAEIRAAQRKAQP